KLSETCFARGEMKPLDALQCVLDCLTWCERWKLPHSSELPAIFEYIDELRGLTPTPKPGQPRRAVASFGAESSGALETSQSGVQVDKPEGGAAIPEREIDRPFQFRRDQRSGKWHVRYLDESDVFAHLEGLGHIAKLLAMPDKSTLALALTGCSSPIIEAD